MFFNDYVSKNNFVYKIDPRIKIFLSLILTSCLFASKFFLSKLIVIFFVFLCFTLTQVPLNVFFKKLKFAFIILIFSSLANLFYYSKGNSVFKLFNVSITDLALKNSLISFFSSLTLILICVIVTFSTTTTEVVCASRTFFKFLKIFKIDINDISLIFMLVLRFLPIVFEETERIMRAQRCRGAFSNKSLIKKIKSVSSVLIPIFTSCFRKALEIALAIECKFYGYTQSRTSLKLLKIKSGDLVAVFCVFLILVGVVFCEIKKY